MLSSGAEHDAGDECHHPLHKAASPFPDPGVMGAGYLHGTRPPGRKHLRGARHVEQLHAPFSADDAALVLIDFQPQMFMGVESHDRNAIKNNPQIIAKSAKLFNVKETR